MCIHCESNVYQIGNLEFLCLCSARTEMLLYFAAMGPNGGLQVVLTILRWADAWVANTFVPLSCQLWAPCLGWQESTLRLLSVVFCFGSLAISWQSCFVESGRLDLIMMNWLRVRTDKGANDDQCLMLVSMGVQTLLLITLWMRRVMTAWVKMTHDDSCGIWS